MRVFSVVGHGNGSGKTLLMERLLEAHPARFAAVKFTTIFGTGGFCPKDAQEACACTKLHGDHHVLTDPTDLAQPDTDTGRLMAAGASPVLWCLARPGAHAAAWHDAAELLSPSAEVLTEGNTAVPFLAPAPSAVLFVANPCVPMRTWKSNWRELAARASAILVNESAEALSRGRPAPQGERAAARAALAGASPGALVVEAALARPWSQWAPAELAALLA